MGTQQESLEAYLADLLRFNRALNLVSRQLEPDAVRALVEEGVAAAKALAGVGARHWLDIGTGAGLPGIPFAICRPDCKVVLMERRASRVEFLRREKSSLGLELMQIELGDAADLAARGDLKGQFDGVLLKAVAEPLEALVLAKPYLREGARAWIFRDESWTPGPLEGWGSPERINLEVVGRDPQPTIFGFAPNQLN